MTESGLKSNKNS